MLPLLSLVPINLESGINCHLFLWNCILVDLRKYGTPTLRFYLTAYSAHQPYTVYPLRQHTLIPCVLYTMYCSRRNPLVPYKPGHIYMRHQEGFEIHSEEKRKFVKHGNITIWDLKLFRLLEKKL